MLKQEDVHFCTFEVSYTKTNYVFVGAMTYFHGGLGSVIDEIHCSGSESWLFNCTYGDPACFDGEAAGLQCRMEGTKYIHVTDYHCCLFGVGIAQQVKNMQL